MQHYISEHKNSLQNEDSDKLDSDVAFSFCKISKRNGPNPSYKCQLIQSINTEFTAAILVG